MEKMTFKHGLQKNQQHYRHGKEEQMIAKPAFQQQMTMTRQIIRKNIDFGKEGMNFHPSSQTQEWMHSHTHTTPLT